MFGVEALNTSLQVNVGIIGSEEKTYIKNSPQKKGRSQILAQP